MEAGFEGAKSIIDKQVESGYIFPNGEVVTTYQKVFPWTNENVNAYLNLVDFEGKDSALTTLASGDQLFNIVAKGITNVDTFDVNALTEYYALGLKRAMILKYDYKEFISIVPIIMNPFVGIEMVIGLIRSLFPYMEKKHQEFWAFVLDYSYAIQKRNAIKLNPILMLTMKGYFLESWEYNTYLLNPQNYENLKTNLRNANITFTQTNALELPSHFNKEYDFILLSNILDYFHKTLGENWGYDKLQEYEHGLEKITKRDGTIFLHYIIGYLRDNKMYRKQMINKAAISPRDLTDEQLIVIPGENPINHGMILKRIK